ncbi:gallidermin family lantibiotic [Evansella halocellulosilytica]|uniref:gallidermin family lantibiotic n=1 Tax=Evansella halocellulosilytica TaxID=2011013 RepID=UPI000BB83732|nr:gallidermin family lantibiotic [Evansella halocellulosilytica]
MAQKNDFDLDVQVQNIQSSESDVAPLTGGICTPSCLTGTLNCRVSLTFCRTC